MMHIHSLHQGQNQILRMLEHTDRTVEAEEVLQYLQQSPSRHFTHGKEKRHLYLLPQQGEQGQSIQWPFCQQGIILEESILEV